MSTVPKEASAIWEQFRALFRRYSSSDPAGFAADFRSALYQATKTGTLTDDQQAGLLRLRALVEAWGAQETGLGDELLRAWLALRSEVTRALPSSLVDSVLYRFPRHARSSITWSVHLAADIGSDALEAMLEQKVLKPGDLVGYAKQHPQEFLDSAALDVLLEHGTAVPRNVWDAFLGQVEQGPELASLASALARSFAVDNGGDAGSWLIGVLTDHEALRRPVVKLVLANPVSTERVARALTTAAVNAVAARKGGPSGDASPILDTLLAAIEDQLDANGQLETHHIWALGTLGLATYSQSASFTREHQGRLDSLLGRVAGIQIPSVLRALDGGSVGTAPLVVVPAPRLVTVIRDYLEDLPIGGGAEPMDRGTRYQRFLGQKDVLQEILQTLAATGPDGDLRQAIDISLFNLGVRPLAEVSSTTQFDPSRHESRSSGVVPGDPVRVMSAGAQLGEAESGIILVKAGVVSQTQC
ncbi:MAG: hypothetical protein LCH84_08410 [Gemmatimonadetes bacterium]|nr:hypothetical protein [Gemmatimonadota bacterium]